MQVKLLSRTQNAEDLIYAAMRQCYSDKTADELMNDNANKGEFIQKILDSGHESPIEHVSFSFSVSGVSRALSHQLVRHRIASYSQKSQRYVDSGNFDYVTPVSIANNPQALEIYKNTMETIQKAYKALTELETPKEDARYVLPNACETSLVVTMNCRSLIHFFEERCCKRSQHEVRQLADRMHAICALDLPCVFSNVWAKCERIGYCPEAYGCGRMPSKKEFFNA